MILEGLFLAQALAMPPLTIHPHSPYPALVRFLREERGGAGSPAILVAEDDPMVAHGLRLMLEHLGYGRVLVVADGEAALRAWSAEGPFDLLVTDDRMDGMDGPELIASLRCCAPTLPVVLTSGWAGYANAALAADPFLWLCQKPYTARGLCAALDRALTGRKRRIPRGRP